MQNLYDLLRKLQDQARKNLPGAAPLGASDKTYVLLSPSDIEFLNQYLHAPDHQIHFKARKIGDHNGEPVYAQDYAIAGETVNIFCLLTEAMMANSSFAAVVGAALKFFYEHVPNCPDCDARLDYANPEKPDWTFVTHKPK